jgi:hypothetical protein
MLRKLKCIHVKNAKKDLGIVIIYQNICHELNHVIQIVLHKLIPWNLRIPELNLRIPESNLRIPESNLRIPESNLRIPELNLRLPELKVN